MSEIVTRALVAGHADFAAGLVSAVEQITGKGGLLMPIQVRGLCGDDIHKLLRDSLIASGAMVIFTDLQAGSCTMAAMRAQRDVPGVVLVSGASLPMLLDFVLSPNPNAAEAAKAAAEKGRAAIREFGGPA